MAGARGLVLALLVLLVPAGALAQPKFPPLTGRVVDNAQLLSPQTEQRLTNELAQLEASTGRQVVVATLPDLQGYEIEEYGYQLGRAWGVGSRERDDGALLIVAPNERKVRIEVGYGLEGVLTDALSSVIIQTAILPQFRQGNYEQGVVAGVDQLVRQLSLPDEEARANVAQAEQARQARAGDGGSAIPVIFVIFVIFWILSGILGGFGRRGRGRRRGGGGMWWLLPLILSSGGGRHRGGGWGGGGGGFGGGFSGGGGSFGGGGSSGSW